MRRIITTGALFGMFFMLGSSLSFAQDDVIQARKNLMKASNAIVSKDLKAAVEEKNYTTVGVKAKEIMENMDKASKLFPKGSTGEKSRAHPDIWVKNDVFQKDMANAKKAAEDLMKAAEAKNEADVTTKVKALGNTKSGACGECHKMFRTDFRKDS
jgi:cytochrome c556